MFDSLSFRSQRPYDPDAPMDLGALVEGLLFYGRTEVILDSPSIKQIAKFWSPDDLLTLVNSGHATFAYQQTIAAIKTERSGSNRERHVPVIAEIAESQAVKPRPELLIGRVLAEVTGRRGRARRLTSQLCSKLQIRRADPDIARRVTTDLLDSGFVESGVKRILAIYAPELSLPNNLRFDVGQVDGGLRVITNIDFAAVNAVYHLRIPPSHSSITPAFLLAHLLLAREMAEEAARSGADMAASPVHAALAASRFEAACTSYATNEANVTRFQEFLFNDGRAIREAVNQHQATFKDVMMLLERAAKFRHWLEGHSTDTDLAKAYFQAVTASTWVDKLPTKAVRWMMFTGAGLGLDAAGAGGVGTALGIGLGALDTFLLDALIRGWKPNQFVESELRPFVDRKRD